MHQPRCRQDHAAPRTWCLSSAQVQASRLCALHALSSCQPPSRAYCTGPAKVAGHSVAMEAARQLLLSIQLPSRAQQHRAAVCECDFIRAGGKPMYSANSYLHDGELAGRRAGCHAGGLLITHVQGQHHSAAWYVDSALAFQAAVLTPCPDQDQLHTPRRQSQSKRWL